MNKLFFLTFLLFILQIAHLHAFADKNNSNTKYRITLDTLNHELVITRHAFYFEDHTNTIQPDSLKNLDWEPFKKIPTFQPSESAHWFKVVLDNKQKYNIKKVLFVPYNSIYTIDIYQESNDSIYLIKQTGIQRHIKNKGFRIAGFPAYLNLPSETVSTVYVKFKHVYRPLRTTMYLLNPERFSEILYESNSLLWLWRGLYLFAIVLSIMAWFFLKQKSFLYYALLNLGVSFYVFSHIGEIQMIMGSDPTDISSTVDYIGAFLINLSLPLFLNSLTPIRENNKVLWKIMMVLIYGIVPFVILSFIPEIRLNSLTLIVHNYIMIVSGIVLLLQIYFLTKNTLLKKENGLIMLIIYTLYIIFSFIDIILPNMGVLEDGDYICKLFFIGSFIEVFSFMMLMSKQTLGVYNERAKLRERYKNHQRELLLSIVKSQEVERIRTGRELHDLIGANIAIIKQRVNTTDPDLEKLMTQTIDSIRNLSHGLVASNITDSEFNDEIKELCYTASTDEMNFHVYFHAWPLIKNTETTTHLYRITQELVQNALKHSQASEVYFQFTGTEKDKIMLMYEDNGVGFKLSNNKKDKGLGILNIKNRVNLLNGILEIESDLNGSGTNILIEIKLKTD